MFRTQSAATLVLCTLLALPAFAQSTPEPADDDARLEALSEQLERQQQQLEALAAQLEAGASAKGARNERVKIGGYGEMHYNNLDAEDPAKDLKQIDFHRFIIYLGYDFSDRIRFRSELELEHAFFSKSSGGGELELEQAFLEFDLTGNTVGRAGIILVPVGILNETHEPPTFYGVERNDVESIIIPSTWWGGGASVTQRFDSGFSFDFAVQEGLKAPTTGVVRSGRQKTSNADASDLAATARLKFTAIPGVELAASVNYQGDITQVAGDGLDEAWLYSGHAIINAGPFALRALYAEWDLSGASVPAAAATQTGWYVEPSIKLADSFGLYARFEDVDAARDADRFDQWEGGFNYWPHPQVVLKADYRKRNHDLTTEAGRDFEGFDLGVGYNF